MTEKTLETIVAQQGEQILNVTKQFGDHCEKQNHNLERIWDALEGLKDDLADEFKARQEAALAATQAATAASKGQISKVEAAIGAAGLSALVALIVYIVTGR